MSGPITVCHVITLLELGGAQENTLYTVTHLRPPYHARLVCGPGGFLDREARDESGVPITFIPALVRPIRPGRDLAALIQLTRLLRLMRPVIVHTHSSKAGILGRLAARLAGVPIVVHTIHGFGFNDRQGVLLRATLLGLEKLASRLTTHAVAVSRADLERGLRLGVVQRGRASVIRSGFPVERFEAAGRETAAARARLRRDIGAPDGAPVIGMVACLKPQKSPQTFVDVAARVAAAIPAARFVLVGDGELRGAVEARAGAVGLRERFHLLGWRRDVPQVMAGLDVFLLTSLWEGLPKVIPQAIAVGVPVVATAVDGTRDILEDGVNGLISPAGDVPGLADRVLRLLREPELAARLAKRARSILPEFEIDGMVRAQEDLYGALLRNAGPAARFELQELPGQ